MNAAEQATSPEVTGKIAAMINLVKQKFPKAKANLTPWTNDPDTREWVDPSSIDVGFNLPAGHTLMQLRSMKGVWWELKPSALAPLVTSAGNSPPLGIGAFRDPPCPPQGSGKP